MIPKSIQNLDVKPLTLSVVLLNLSILFFFNITNYIYHGP